MRRLGPEGIGHFALHFPLLPVCAQRPVELRQRLLNLRLILVGDGVDFGVFGDALQGDVRHGLVDEPASGTAFGVLEFVIVKLRGHKPPAGDGKRHAGGVAGDPSSPPLLGAIRGRARATVMHRAHLGDERMSVFHLEVVHLFFGGLGADLHDRHAPPVRSEEHNIADGKLTRLYPLGMLGAHLFFTGPSDKLANAVQISLHFAGRDAKRLQTKRLQVVVAGDIMGNGVFATVSLHAIHLYDQASFTAVKIGDVATDGMLATEGEAKLVVAQPRPEFSLWRRHLTAEFPAAPPEGFRDARPVEITAERARASLSQHPVVIGEPEYSLGTGMANADHSPFKLATDDSQNAMRFSIMSKHPVSGLDGFDGDKGGDR